MNSELSKYYEEAINRHIEIHKNKQCKLIKKLFHCTHLKGPHIDFYNSPHGLNKSSMTNNMKNFQSKIIYVIDNLLLCEQHGQRLDIGIIEAMIKQTSYIVHSGNTYWENIGFNNVDSTSIIKTYEMLKIFLETYEKRNTNKRLGDKIYSACILNNIGMYISPNDLQKFNIFRIRHIMKKISNEYNTDFFKMIAQVKTEKREKLINSESKFISTAMIHILSIYNDAAIKFKNSSITIPESHKIKIKQLPELMEDWCYHPIVSGRFIFLNSAKYNTFTSDSLLLQCCNSSVMGTLLINANLSKNMEGHVDKYLKKYPDLAIHKEKIIKSFFSLNFFMCGLSCVAEETYGMSCTNKIELMLLQLTRAIESLIDVGLHSSSANLKMDKDLAKSLMRKFTILSNEEIDASILKILSFPGKSCAVEFGRYGMSKIKKYINDDVKFYEHIFSCPFPYDILKKTLDMTQKN